MKRKIPAMRPAGSINSMEAARLLGVSKATFFRYRSEPDFPQPVQAGKGGRESLYLAAEVIAWRDKRIAAAGGGQAGTDDSLKPDNE